MKIGNFEIFDNQIEAGDKYYEALIANQCPYLATLTQVGKTGTLIYTTSKILDYCIDNKINNFQIIYAQCFADLEVKKQTKKDIEEAFDGGYKTFTPNDLLNKINPIIKSIHHPEFKNIQLKNHITYFIIFDEAQQSINKLGLIDKFRSLIMNIGCKCYIGYSSATPFAYDILEKLSIPTKNFKCILLEPGINYYGIPQLFKDNRIKLAEDELIDDKNNLTDFAKNIFIPDFIDKIKMVGASYAPARIRDITEQQAQTLCNHIKVKYDIDVIFSFYNSEEDNIDDLGLKLKSKPSISEFIFIKGALRAGKRLCKDFIGAVLDTGKTANCAVTIQSLLGRVSGYNITNKNFNIYCDTSEVENYVKWWNDTQSGIVNKTIPSSRFNVSNTKTTIIKCNISFHSTFASASQKALSIGISATSAGWRAHISKNNYRDICHFILKGIKPSAKSFIYEIDKANTNYVQSYNDLLLKYPNVQNMYVLFEPVKAQIISLTTSVPTQNNLTKNNMFN